MRQRVGFPFKRISNTQPKLSDWVMIVDGQTSVLGNQIEGWDYNKNFELCRNIELDVTACLSECGLEESEATLKYTISIETGPSGMRWTVYQSPELQDGVWQVDSAFAIESSRLKGKFSLRSEIVLSTAPEKPKTLAPVKPGSRLWSETKDVLIEGFLGRFPLEAVDFSKKFEDPNLARAKWFLDWSGAELDAAFLGNVLLSVNSGDENLMANLKGEDPYLIPVLANDIVRQLASALIEREDFVSNAETFDEGSLGAIVSNWVYTAFPKESFETVRELKKTDPSRFEARLQAVFGGSND